MYRPLALALAALLLFSLSGCGKAGRPLQPADSTYPKIYPNPTATPPTAPQRDGRALPPEWDQQDLKARFTQGGSYIDPSTQVAPGQIPLNSNLPNTTRSVGSDPFSQGLVSTGQSPLPPVQPIPTPSTDDEDQRQ